MQRSIRGATTIIKDTKENVIEATKELLYYILTKNAVETKDIVNIIFTATSDITSTFPAVAAREVGLTSVPLIDCQQMMCDDALELCIRVMLTYNTEKSQDDIRHVYLHEAKKLRPDLIK
ncbi:chorismate mutase [Francisella sp. SYW-9]|uniref:chorismate mutase n=1 Tax=Francisella sp. SYW-9 TaxID=2610888 RepID=UPI00123DBB33|nr:chorismate mutase [Francisella sp. SYW-9]